MQNSILVKACQQVVMLTKRKEDAIEPSKVESREGEITSITSTLGGNTISKFMVLFKIAWLVPKSIRSFSLRNCP
jgi:hypothetical protein